MGESSFCMMDYIAKGITTQYINYCYQGKKKQNFNDEDLHKAQKFAYIN